MIYSDEAMLELRMRIDKSIWRLIYERTDSHVVEVLDNPDSKWLIEYNGKFYAVIWKHRIKKYDLELTNIAGTSYGDSLSSTYLERILEGGVVELPRHNLVVQLCKR